MAQTDLLDLWDGETCTALELAEAAIATAGRTNPALNAILTLTPEAARAQARAVDRARARGERPLLDGMPVTLKDNIDTAGVRTTVAAAEFVGHVPNADAVVVERLVAAGAVLVGKANMHEFALGATTQSPHLGACRNPWNPEHVPGGSSGGSGASVAARMCIASLGSDTGGSIRNPASFNGVCGLKPTHGRVPNRGSFPVSPGHDCIGPLAVRVRDVARVYMAIAGYDADDPTSDDCPVEDVLGSLDDGIDGARIGLPSSFYFDDLDPEVHAGVMAAVGTLEDAGARTRAVDLPEAERAWRVASTLLVMTDAAELHEARLRATPPRIGADLHARISPGLDVSGVEFSRAMRFRDAWRVTVRRAFAEVDLVAVPATPFAAPRVDECADMGGTSNQINRFNFTWSLAGVPALSVPCGFTAAGLPYGLQLVAPWWAEAALLRAGHAYQAATDWHLRRPAGTA